MFIKYLHAGQARERGYLQVASPPTIVFHVSSRKVRGCAMKIVKWEQFSLERPNSPTNYHSQNMRIPRMNSATYGMTYATKQTIPIIWNEGDNWIDSMKIKNVVVLTESAMKRET